MKPLSTTGLIKIFEHLGLPLSMKTLDNYQKSGKLVLRRLPNGRRVVEQEDLEDIIKNFSPGGSGKWNYEKTKEGN